MQCQPRTPWQSCKPTKHTWWETWCCCIGCRGCWWAVQSIRLYLAHCMLRLLQHVSNGCSGLPFGPHLNQDHSHIAIRNTGVHLFRLSLALQTFSKCICVALKMRLQNIRFMNYLDDWLAHSECPEAQYQDNVFKLLKDLGLRVNLGQEHTVVTPTDLFFWF